MMKANMDIYRGILGLALLAALPSYGMEVKVLDGLPGSGAEKVAPPSVADTASKPAPAAGQANTSVKPKPAGGESAKDTKSPEAIIDKIEIRDAKLVDVIRAFSEMSGMNIVATKTAADKDVAVFLQNISVKDALETVVKNSGLWYRVEKGGKAYRIMTTEEYQQDMVVFRDDETKIFNLLHPNPYVVATAIRDLYGNRVILALGVDDPTSGLSASSIISGGGRISGGGGGGTATNRAGGGGAAARNTARNAARAGGAGGNGLQSENAVTEKMTPEQLSRLEGALAESPDGKVSAEAMRLISNSEQPIYITINREHNLVLVRTSDAIAMKEIGRLIREMDKPTPQVLLEMKVLELSVGDSFRQIFNIENNFAYRGTESQIKLGNNTIPTEAGSLIYNYLSQSIFARLELLEKNNQINTVSSPVLLASNNRPARVFVGDEWVLIKGVTVTDPVLNAVGQVVTPAKVTFQTEDRDIGNTLTILPKINADRTVTLAIQQDTSTVSLGAITLPPISVGNSVETFKIDSVKTATIEGTVIAKDGLTVAIGGLISTTHNNDVRKVPLLGDIPYLGELFKRKDQSSSKKELMLLITPHIITNPMEGVNVTDKTMDNLPLEIEEW